MAKKNDKNLTLEERVKKAILQESLFRWESAVIISLSLFLAVIAAVAQNSVGVSVAQNVDPNSLAEAFSLIGSSWWLLGGVLAEVGLIFSSLKDPEFSRKIAADMLRHEFEPEKLSDKKLQAQVKKALDYRSRIQANVHDQDSSVLKHELSMTASQIDDWLENIYDLARQVDRYRQQERILGRDYQQAQQRIAQLKHELTLETDPAVKSQIESTLDAIHRQLDTINRLENTIQRAELQLENTLTHLGTIYSQTMLFDAKDIDSGRAKRLRQEIDDEVTELNDVLLAMDEVYATESAG